MAKTRSGHQPLFEECFICASDVFKAQPSPGQNSLQQNQAEEEAMNAFVLENVLDLPSDVKSELELDEKCSKITYCSQCLDHIKRIRIALEGLQKLEKHVLDMKFEIEIKLKESWEKRQLDNSPDILNGANSVTQLKNRVTQGLTKNAMLTMLDKIHKNELGKQPRPNFRIMKNVTVDRNPALDAQAQKQSHSKVIPKNEGNHSKNSSPNTSPSESVPGPSKRTRATRAKSKSLEKEGNANANNIKKVKSSSSSSSGSEGDSPDPKPKRKSPPRRRSTRKISDPIIMEDGDVSSSSDWSGAENIRKTRKRIRRENPPKKIEKPKETEGSDEEEFPDISKFVDVVLAVKTEVQDSDIEIIDGPETGIVASNANPRPGDVLTVSDGFDYMSMYDGAPGHAVPGDVLVLTKPLGTELAVNAHQWADIPDQWRMINGSITEKDLHKAFLRGIDTRDRLNLNAAKLMVKHKAHAAIQVNENGLFNQANELARNQIAEVSFVIHNLPVIAKMHALDKVCGDLFQLRQGMSKEISGGLLIVLPREAATTYCKEIEKEDGYPAWIIGLVDKGDRTARILDKPRLIDVPAKESDKLW